MDNRQQGPYGGYAFVIAVVVSSIASAAAYRAVPDWKGFAVSIGIGAVVGGITRWWTYRSWLRAFAEADDQPQETTRPPAA